MSSNENRPCPQLPELSRLTYFYGQLLSARDFRDEQTYFREKLKLYNRCLHGYGVACGLEVVPEPLAKDCEPEADREREQLETELHALERRIAKLEKKRGDNAYDEGAVGTLITRIEEIRRQLEQLCPAVSGGEKASRVRLECGLAFDCEGNEIIVRRPLSIDPLALLDPVERREVEDRAEAQTPEPSTLFLYICFCEQPIEPVRPVRTEHCGPVTDCVHARIRDSFRLRATLEVPADNERCDPCCEPCGDPCLLLTKIKDFLPGQAIPPENLHLDVRRRIATHELSTVAEISWKHGGVYSIDEAATLLGYDDPKGGLEVRFTNRIRGATVKPGVVEVVVTEGGSGNRASRYHLFGELIVPPNKELVKFLRFHQISDEYLNPGDRVHITVRTDFLLDACCRPVDGNHVGGRVPVIEEFAQYGRVDEPENCLLPPRGYGPWTSGNGTPGGTFESWFTIEESKRSRGRKK